MIVDRRSLARRSANRGGGSSVHRHAMFIVVLGAGCWVLSACSGFRVPVAGSALSIRATESRTLNQEREPSTQNPAPRTAETSQTPARALVTSYCITCHNSKLQRGNLAFEKVDAAHVAGSSEIWEKVIVQLRMRSMPPPGVRRPDNATYDATATWLEAELDRAAAASPNPGRPADLHRLNRAEYTNAVRDLLGVEIDGAAMLPADEQAHGFDTNADALTVVPALLDRYLTAAAKVSRLALGDSTIRPAFERYTAVKNNSNERTWLWQTERLGEEFPLGSRGGIFARHYFPVDGEYVFKVRLDRTYTGLVRGLNVPNEIEIRVDGERVGQFTLGGPEFSAAAARASGPDYEDAGNPLFTADDRLEVRVPVKAGLRQVVVTAVRSDASRPEGLGPARIPIWGHDYDGDIRAPLVISLLLIGGPYNGQVPDTSPSRQRIFPCYPPPSREALRRGRAVALSASAQSAPARPRQSSKSDVGAEADAAKDEASCATKILSALARRAYRRPVTKEDVNVLLAFYRRGRAEGDFEAGIRTALERILVSPDFLFRIEADPLSAKPGTVYRLSDVELASRLSFFLWSSIPDEELLGLAIDGKLRDARVLERQVRRMLADRRARTALVGNFFGQWMQIRNVWLLTPDANRKFPWFDDNLRTALVTEAELFFESQLGEDRSVLDLLTADYTFLNEQLARHYGIGDVSGSHFRRVMLTDQKRWGLLGKGSILAVTSYPHRTSPTIRGKWLLENILAAPVPPPPPTVNTTLEEGKAAKTTSVREMLEQHRSNAVCASCHARMDPLGYSLENFDALGQWRTKDGEAPIDASGVLLDGTKVDGPVALRAALLRQKDQFLKAVTGKLLMYALGRELEHFDLPAIRSIIRVAEPDEYRWSSIISALVKSTPFQMRRTKQIGDPTKAEPRRVARAQAVGDGLATWHEAARRLTQSRAAEWRGHRRWGTARNVALSSLTIDSKPSRRAARAQAVGDGPATWH